MNEVQTARQGAIEIITMNRPGRLNAMSIDLMSQLVSAFESARDDNAVRVVVLTGANEAFSSGLDLKDYGVVPNIDGLAVGEIAQRSMRHYSQMVPLMRSLHQPVIAAIDGPAYGGGMCLALGADVRIASQRARFNATGIVNGLSSAEMGISYLLPRLVGAAHSFDLLMTGRVINGDEAYRIGLVSRLVADPLAEALEVAERVCSFSKYGVAQTKSTLWANLETSSLFSAIELEDRNQLLMGFTNNLPTAITAFRDGATPEYLDEPRHDIWTPPDGDSSSPT